VETLELVDFWPATTVAVVVTDAHREIAERGPRDWVRRFASITKLLTAYACLVAAEEGALDLDAPAGPPGSTVRHLLAHASGLPFDAGAPIARPGERRIYSNSGFEVLGEHVAGETGMQFAEYREQAVIRPLGLRATLDPGEPWQAAAGLRGAIDDVAAFARELLAPTLVAPETLAEATRVAFPGLGGVLPGVGRFEPNDWGLGFELRDGKEPHWTGGRSSARTFGHFGGSGTFLWIDPEAGIACGCLTDLDFDDWGDAAIPAWSALSDAVLAEWGTGR
jgi:CubicO group peptidase (beta-lactamase class C family)